MEYKRIGFADYALRLPQRQKSPLIRVWYYSRDRAAEDFPLTAAHSRTLVQIVMKSVRVFPGDTQRIIALMPYVASLLADRNTG